MQTFLSRVGTLGNRGLFEVCEKKKWLPEGNHYVDDLKYIGTSEGRTKSTISLFRERLPELNLNLL